MTDVAIIGCGVIGAAAAYYLSGYGAKVLILERENDVSMGTSRANSAILHAGYSVRPGSLMAQMNVRGVRLAQEICEVLDVPYRQVGSLVLAFGDEDLEHLRQLYGDGKKNGVPGLKLLNQAEVLAMEPNLSDRIQGALYAPTAAIVSPWEYTLAMAENAVENGACLELETEVTGLEQIPAGGWRIHTQRGAFEARFVLNAAGVEADRIHAMAAPLDFHTTPCRGEYYLLDRSEGKTVHHIIFQCPTRAGKGVLVAPTVHGNLIVGPNAEDIDDGENTATTAHGLAAVAEAARKSVPGLQLNRSIRNFAGVRANTDASDFVIKWAAPGLLDLAGMKSPGLSAAAAVGEYAVKLLRESGLILRDQPTPVTPKKRVRFRELSAQQQAERIRQDPAYGHVICRCETVTEGEIVAACHTPIPPRSIDGIKRRTNAGMGRCQGGFCGPRVMEILSRELGIDPLKIPQDRAQSFPLTGRTKQRGGADDV